MSDPTPPPTDAPPDPPGDLLARLAASLGDENGAARRPAPVDRWNPPFCGDIDMAIALDGSWHYMGTPIARPALVRLFASVLRRDEDRYVLVTPVERVGIRVADAPFLAVAMAAEGEGEEKRIVFRTNLDDTVAVGPDNPLRFALDEAEGVKPYVLVRGGLWARATRAVALELLDLAEERVADGRTAFVIAAAGTAYRLPDTGASEIRA